MTLLLIVAVLLLIWFNGAIPEPWRIVFFIVIVVLLVLWVAGAGGVLTIPPHWR